MSRNDNIWRGTEEEYCSWYDNNKFDKIISCLKDNEDLLTMYSETVREQNLQDFRRSLQRGDLILTGLETYIQNNPKENTGLDYAIGHLRGVMDLASRICYTKRKDLMVKEHRLHILEVFEGILDFDKLVRYLDEHDNAKISEVAQGIGVDQSVLRKLAPELENTMFIYARGQNKWLELSLSDDGLRYAKQLRIKETPEQFGLC